MRRKKKILVVDDDHSLREVLRLLLENDGFDVTCAGNGREALGRLRAESPQPCLILLDVMMPVMDGHQFLAERKRDPEIAQIPTVVLTASDHATVNDDTVEVLPKPFEIRTLFKVIDQLC